MSYRIVRTPQRARDSRHVGHYRRRLPPGEEEMMQVLARPALAVAPDGKGRLLCALDAGAYDNPAAWGRMLADIVGHVANAYACRGLDPSGTRAAVIETFLAEIQHPTDKPVRIGQVRVGGGPS